MQVADFMAGLCIGKAKKIRILDPGAGTGILACALCERLACGSHKLSQIVLEAYEVDHRLLPALEKSLDFLKRCLEQDGISLTFGIRKDDFIMRHAEALDNSLSLLPNDQERRDFDIVISNPPYFKLSKTDPRVRVASPVVCGQPNVYALFMAVSACMLRRGGELISITPRSFASGPYFRLFRQWFFAKMRPEVIHIFHSRQDAFKREAVLQENVIMKSSRVDGWIEKANNATISISSSNGVNDLQEANRRTVRLRSVLDMGSDDKSMKIPLSKREDGIIEKVRLWPGLLSTYGLAISTGPIVPFRVMSLLSRTGDVPKSHAPLLWMQNVHAMRVDWPTAVRNKPQYIKLADDAFSLLVANKNYVLIRRFSAKEEPRRLTAAVLMAGAFGSPLLGLENHLNYIYRPGGSLTNEEAWGLAALYNSSLLDTYFRTMNGSTQVSATELRAMPLPSLDVIAEVGRRVMDLQNPENNIASLVEPVVTGLCTGVCEVAVGG